MAINIATASESARHPRTNSLVPVLRLCTLDCLLLVLLVLRIPSSPSHLDSPSRLDLERPIVPRFNKQPRPSDRPSRWPTPLVRAAPKKPPTDVVLIARGPLQVGPWSGLLLYSDCLLLYIDSTTSRSLFLPPISVLNSHLLPPFYLNLFVFFPNGLAPAPSI